MCAVARPDSIPQTTSIRPPRINVPGSVVLDTLQVPRKALRIREIVERCIEGERTKLGGHHNMTFTGTLRSVLWWKNKKVVGDEVFRTFMNDDGFERTVLLGGRKTHYKREDDEWVVDPDAEDDPESVRIETDHANDFSDLPIFFEDVQEFDFELLDRTVQTRHVIFKVSFHPKSEFKPLPSGILYIDTNRYRIIHEEFSFDRNPFPLLVHDIQHLSRQWEELPTGEWVYTKIRASIALRSDPFGIIPQRGAISLERSDFAFDVDYDASVFGRR
jgi:hypothetical protein